MYDRAIKLQINQKPFITSEPEFLFFFIRYRKNTIKSKSCVGNAVITVIKNPLKSYFFKEFYMQKNNYLLDKITHPMSF